MDFSLSEEHRMIIDGAKKFAEKELAPLAAEYDEKQESNVSALKALGELGFAHDGKSYYLAGRKEVRNEPGFDLWKDTTTLFTRLHTGRDAAGPVIGGGPTLLRPSPQPSSPAGAGSVGISNPATAPPPAALPAKARPPCSSATCCTMARPSPEPGMVRAEDER